MANPSGDVYEDIAELYRIVEALSTAARLPRLVRGSFRGQHNPAGNAGARFSLLDSADSIAVEVTGDHAGLAYPHAQTPWRDPSAHIDVTSGSWTPTFYAYAENPAYETVKISFAAVTDVGTTGELRIREWYSGATTDAIAVPSGYSGYVTFEWIVPDMAVGWSDHWQDSGYSTVDFGIEARRTSGTGAVGVWGVLPLIWRNRQFGAPAANGNPWKT